ncbi:MAG: NAD-dependent epimerase/dehydratase family protein [Actinomycetota bacterium]|nr:NAD-dependent epimerase/dehydratase family protein [Actinomycetota bacterium]
MTEQVLVTGGAGFVGRNLVARLVRDLPEATMWVIDDVSTGREPPSWPEVELVPEGETAGPVASFRAAETGARVRFVQGDALAVFLGELGKVERRLPEPLPPFDRAYHLASVVGGRSVIEGDPLAVGIDLAIDSGFFLWAAKVNRPDRILYASSSSAYPVGLQDEDGAVALAETMIDFDRGLLRPDLTYGWSKLTGEYLARLACSGYGLRVAVVRPFSGYGEHQDPVYPVPAIALRAASRADPLVVWGTGEQARDFVHIEDCVEAMERALARIGDGSAVNIGSGRPTTFLELARLMADIEGYAPEVRGLEDRPVGVHRRYAEPSVMREVLEFTPRISLRDGMARVLDVAHRRLDAGQMVPV